MDNNEKIEINKKELEILLLQNKEMKSLLKESYNGFISLNKLINLKDLAKNGLGFIALKLPSIIRNLQDNKDLFSFLNNDFLNKLEKYGNPNKQ